VEIPEKVLSLRMQRRLPLAYLVGFLLVLASVGLVASPVVDDKQVLWKISDDALSLSWQKQADLQDRKTKDLSLRHWRSDGYIVSIDDQEVSRLPMYQWSTETHRAYFTKEPAFSFSDLVPGKTYAINISQVGDYTQKEGWGIGMGAYPQSIMKSPLVISVPAAFHRRAMPLEDAATKVSLKELYDHPNDYLGRVLQVEGFTSFQKEPNPTPIVIPTSLSPDSIIYETITAADGRAILEGRFAWQPAPIRSFVVTSIRSRNDGAIYEGKYQLGVSGGSIWLIEGQSKCAFNYLELLGYLVKGETKEAGARREYFFENLGILKYTKK